MIGIAPITDADLSRTKRNMETRGMFENRDTETIKYIKTLKLTVKMWCKRELNLSDKD